MRSEESQPADALRTGRRGSGRRSASERREEIELMKAMDQYKHDSRRPFPTPSEVLEVLRALGYRKVAERTARPGRPSAKPAKRKVFTTGQVAKICRVAPRTVSKWFDSGRLRGYRIPTSQDRRIPREHLIKFLKEHGMPLGELENEGLHKVLIIGPEQLFVDRLRGLLPEADDFKCALAHSGFEAGTMAASFHPDTIVIDLAMGRSEALQIASNLRRNPQYAQTLILALASEDQAAPEALVGLGFSEAFQKPFDVALLAERIRTRVEEQRAHL
jgi:two-component system response regulator RpaA